MGLPILTLTSSRRPSVGEVHRLSNIAKIWRASVRWVPALGRPRDESRDRLAGRV